MINDGTLTTYFKLKESTCFILVVLCCVICGLGVGGGRGGGAFPGKYSLKEGLKYMCDALGVSLANVPRGNWSWHTTTNSGYQVNLAQIMMALKICLGDVAVAAFG